VTQAINPASKVNVTMVDVMHYFNMKPGDFKKEWGELSDKDKADLKQGIGDGTYDY
jgi:hypothetical protein